MEIKKKVMHMMVKDRKITILTKRLTFENITRYPKYWMPVRVTMNHMKTRNMISCLMSILIIVRMISKIKTWRMQLMIKITDMKVT